MRISPSVVLATSSLALAQPVTESLASFAVPLEGRLAGRPRAAAQAPDLVALARVGSQVRRQAQARGADGLRELALLHVLESHPRAGASTLRRLLLRQPRDAHVWSDLSAYSVETARLEPHDVRELALALDAAATAGALDPLLPEAAFNAALALEKLGLTQAAEDQYTASLGLEADPAAAGLTRRRLAGLARAPDPVGRSPAVAQRLVDGCLFQWAETRQSGSFEAPAWAEARQIAEQSLATTHDRFLLDALDAARQLAEHGDPDSSSALAAGLRSFQAGVLALNADALEQAEHELGAAAQTLAPLRHPYAALAASLQAASLQVRSRHEQARPLLRGLLDDIAGRGYPRLEGQSWRRLGLAEQVLSDPGRALTAYQRALRAAESCGDTTGLADTLTAIDDVYETLGERQLAWRLRPRLLSTLALMDPANERRHLVLDQLARSLRGEGLQRAALALGAETLHARRGSRDPVSRAMALLGQGLAQLSLGDAERASAAVTAARRECADLPDGDLLRRISAEADLVEGRILAQTEPRSASAALDRALEFFREAATPNRAAETLLVRARAELRSGTQAAAEASLEAAALAVEQRRRGVAPRRLREAYQDEMRQVFAEMVGLQALERGNAGLALQYAERGRARLLAEWLSDSEARIADEAVLRAGLPEDALLLEYVSLPERTLVFAVSRRELKLVVLELRPAELRSLVERAREALIARDVDEPLVAAYRALLEPVGDGLLGAHRLVLVPDGPLHDLPFAALIDPQGKLLLETHALQLAPSASLYLATTRRAQDLSRAAWRSTLVVGNPRFDRERWPWLHDLPGAEGEARDVAARYKGARTLVGPAATRSSVLGLAGASDLVHFAGHARVNEADPGRSLLTLAPEPQDPAGALFADEIAALKWPNTRLVVLSTCSSGAGRISSSGGALSLARAFFAAGVPTVVASLWDVDDDATRGLMARFHEGLARGLPPSAALRAAQLELRRVGHAAAAGTWAAFVVIGGEADARRATKKD